ncbi:phytanoyl-CoA dioxygenase family protein [Pedobacter gandavensis]|uniref:phytanoyl-CoA dioxygenase family protein n=1 Tax=Pedobacter gandavensis TaxID=2679963 RepID=UPI0029317FD9|nr:phytanoyl-CoA dioxygenase family protein [Pedobacter gandavensis]
MKDCSFSTLFYQHHELIRTGKASPQTEDFLHTEDIWLSMYGLGKFETYSFIYRDCRDFSHFLTWATELKGADFIDKASQEFHNWQENKGGSPVPEEPITRVLSDEQIQFWEENGYLRIPEAIEAAHCDRLKTRICKHLNLHMDFPETWYIPHPDWQGTMLQMYQNEDIELVRQSPFIRQIFAELYQTDYLVPVPEKLGYNPPQTESWNPGQGKLHWDLDINEPIKFHIQGMIYLDEVPENRGPLQIIPGFHHHFEEWIKDFSSLERAHDYIRITGKPVLVPGAKADLILWRNTCPHAASMNSSDLPRFVQYVSYNQL